MNIRLATLLVGTSIAAATPALATPVITFTSRDYTIPSYTTATVFQDFESAPDGGSPYVPAANEVTTGDVRVYSSSMPGLAVDPDSDENHFLSIENGSYSVAFGAPVQFFSFIIGSVDSYNNLVLSYADGTSQSFAGRQIIGEADPGPFNSDTWGRVNYDLGGQSGIVLATFSSTRAALEIDDLASAVPEASTWAMMLVGVGMIGFAARRRATPKVRFA